MCDKKQCKQKKTRRNFCTFSRLLFSPVLFFFLLLPISRFLFFWLHFFPLRCKTTQTAIFIEKIRTFLRTVKFESSTQMLKSNLSLTSPKHLYETCLSPAKTKGDEVERWRNKQYKIIFSEKAFDYSWARLAKDITRIIPQIKHNKILLQL